MYVPIDINVIGGTELLSQLQVLELRNEVANTLANEFSKNLAKNASSKLNKTKQIYLDSISVELDDFGGGKVILDTNNFLTNMVENGIPSFDMKVGFLNSNKVKIAKNGQKYIVIPIDPKAKDFRVVSESSPANSWIHPGYEGHRFLENTANDFDAQGLINSTTEDFIKQLK